MTVHFYDDAHEAFFREKLERAAASGRTPDNYFRSFLYLCGLCPDTRSHFQLAGVVYLPGGPGRRLADRYEQKDHQTGL